MKRWPLTLAALLASASLVAAGCTGNAVAVVATATLAPIVSLTPRATATPVPTTTALPSATFTPSTTPTDAPPTLTPTVTPTPQVLGSVYSQNDVNMREGPGVTFPAASALRPGTGFIVVATDESGGWFNVRLDDGQEGWISATLVRLQPTETPLPTTTPTPDGTLLALGGPLPTSILGGQPVTPTPPRAVTTVEAVATNTGVQLPDLAAINQTATALVGVSLPVGTQRPIGGPTGGPLPSGSATAAPPIGSGTVGEGVEVFAYCDDPGFSVPRAPTNLVTGSTIEIVWAWYASTRELLADNVAAANYDVRLNGQPVSNVVRAAPRQTSDGNWWQYFYSRTQPLNSGPQEITFTVTWDEAIYDGYGNYGPGTGIPSQSGTCTFTVR
ncbi:MAG TPA: SH3 domain-containing protein [Candidatus Limnocylindrales bacterium]|nr:SH3 domain-containing protein [Candidatus Limnocylindrales bacterium]